jgi:hypothetical protein
MSTARKEWTRGGLVHNTAGRCSQKKKDQKENEEPSPVVDTPVPSTKLWNAATAPPAYPQPVTVPYTSLSRVCLYHPVSSASREVGGALHGETLEWMKKWKLSMIRL